MKDLDRELSKFRSRVRMVRAWRGLAVGGTVGGLFSIALAVLDWRRVAEANWMVLATPVVVGMVVGAAAGFLMKIGGQAIAKSLDRRAGLKDRLTTAREEHHEAFADSQRDDAFAHLNDATPRKVYPFRLTGWHFGPVACFAVASAIYLLAGASLFMSPDQKAEREEVKKEGAKIEKVAKEALQRPVVEVGKEERALANELAKRAREMQRGRVGKEEMLQANEESQKKLNELINKRFDAADKNMMQAQSVAEKMAIAEAQKKNEISPEMAKEMTAMLENQRKGDENSQAKPGQRMSKIEQQLQSGKNEQGKPMSQDERAQLEAEKRAIDEAMKDVEKRLDEIQKQLESGKDAQGNPLSEEDRKKLEAFAKQLQELMKEFKLSQKVQEMLQKMQQMEDFKELQEILSKMRQNQQATERGEVPTLSKEELEQLREKLKEAQKKLEEMAKNMTDKQMKEMLERMIEAAKNARAGNCSSCMGLGLGMGLLPGMGMNMPGGPGKDMFFRNSGQVPLQNPTEAKGKAFSTSVTGKRQEKGDESYMEVRGPTGLGQRSKTPYYKVLPTYKKKAEEALEKEAIPQEHRKRVKEYFDSLQGGTKGK
jgi:hypothetical protein